MFLLIKSMFTESGMRDRQEQKLRKRYEALLVVKRELELEEKTIIAQFGKLAERTLNGMIKQRGVRGW